VKKSFILLFFIISFGIVAGDNLYFKDDGKLMNKPIACNSQDYNVAFAPNEFKLYIDCGMNDNYEYYSKVRRDYILELETSSVLVVLINKNLTEVVDQPKFLPQTGTNNFMVLMRGEQWYQVVIPIETQPIPQFKNKPVHEVSAPSFFGTLGFLILTVFIIGFKKCKKQTKQK